MNEKLQEAVSLFNKGDKSQASKLLMEIVQKNPLNTVAWYGLALCVDELEKKVYCLKRVLILDPSNKKAQQMLDKLQVNKNSPNQGQVTETHSLSVDKKVSIINRPVVYIIGIVGLIITLIVVVSRLTAYKPNVDDAFSYAAGFALAKMYAHDPLNYWCVENEVQKAANWYKIQVSDLGNGRYYVIGAIKAIDQECWYNTGYFTATVHYDFDNQEWKLDGVVYISNPCMTVSQNDSGECTDWKPDWTPDINWRPPVQ